MYGKVLYKTVFNKQNVILSAKSQTISKLSHINNTIYIAHPGKAISVKVSKFYLKLVIFKVWRFMSWKTIKYIFL